MLHIAVAGAGIGGLACALALDQAGCKVTLFEKTTGAAEAGAGLQLSPNATAALRQLGVLDRVRQDAVVPLVLAIGRGRDGRVLARLPLGPEADRRFGAPFLVTMRADLHQALREAAQGRPGISLRTATALSGWRKAGAQLSLHVADDDQAREIFDGLVGADGLHSTVREKLGFDRGEAVDGARTAWRTTIDTTQVPALFRAPQSNLWLGPGAHIVHYPVAGGRLINLIAALDEPRQGLFEPSLWSTPGDPEEIGSRFAGWAGPLRQLIAAAPAWGKWPLIERAPLRRWSDGRVTLLGDAAHPMLPFLAQGAAQAIEDAVALGRAVDTHGGDVAEAFLAYEAERRPRTARIQAQSHRQGTIYHFGPPASALRDMVLRLTPPARLLARYDWLYGA